MDISLGIDIGTSSIKVCIIDSKSSNILVSECMNHSYTSSVKFVDHTNYSEQNGMQIIQIVDECIQKVGEALNNNYSCHTPYQLVSVVVSGQMHGVVLWNKSPSASLSRILPKPFNADLATEHTDGWTTKFKRDIDFRSNLITWEDKRCNEEFLRTLPITDFTVHSGYGCATLLWLCKYRTNIIEGTQFAGSIMDLLISYICDLDKPIMSDHIANSWGYFDINKCSWQSEILSQAKFPTKLLPEVHPAGSIIGYVSRNWHFVSKGTSVRVAVGDCQCSFLATCNNEVTAVINLGTSSQLAVKLPVGYDLHEVKGMTNATHCFPYFGNSKLAVAASLNGGNVINEFVMMLVSWYEELGLPQINADQLHSRIREISNRAEVTDKSELKIVPTLHGERHNTEKYAQVLNIRSNNISITNVIRQIYTGLMHNLFEIMPLKALKELGIEQIACSGSLFCDNHLLKCIVQDLTGLHCTVKCDVDASYGAAISANFFPHYS